MVSPVRPTIQKTPYQRELPEVVVVDKLLPAGGSVTVPRYRQCVTANLSTVLGKKEAKFRMINRGPDVKFESSLGEDVPFAVWSYDKTEASCEETFSKLKKEGKIY